MKRTSRWYLLLALGLVVLGTAVDSAVAESAMAEAEFVALLATGQNLPVGDSAIGTVPEPIPMIGCTATYNCVHGPILTCNGSVNNSCSSSGGGCGSVTCDGQTTFCPGRCRQHLPIECWSFCPSIGKEPVGCDEFGCCICS